MTLEEEKAAKVEESDASTSEDSAVGSEENANKAEESDVRMTGDSDLRLIIRLLSSTLECRNVSNRIPNIEDNKSHRQNLQYSSESSDYESDESSDDDDEFFRNLRKNVVLPPPKVPAVVKTKGELLPLDLLPVEDLSITENVKNLRKVGKVLHIVNIPEQNQFKVVVESDDNANPLDEESVLFLSSGEPLGKIHEVFGVVRKPNYSVRFNKPEDIHNKGVTQEQDVYYSASNDELTHFILVDDLKKHKGSDASWKDNNEPPDDQIDYSDDEQEKIAKQKRKAKGRKNDRDSISQEEDGAVAPNKMERKEDNYNRERAFGANPSRDRLPSPIPAPTPRAYFPPNNFGYTPPWLRTFSPITSELQRNTRLSPPCGPASSNNSFENFLQRSVPSPQSFEPCDGRSFTQNRVPTPPQPFGTFSQSSAPSYQSFTPPPPSHVFAPSNHASSYATGAPQQHPSFFMPAPQHNVPLQQQLRLQSQQPVSLFLSQPPPNYNTNQNSMTFQHQNHSFTPPTFGALPAAVHTTANQSFGNQRIHSPSNLNISQPRNIAPMNSNGHQGPSYGVGNSFTYPPSITQHSNIHTPVFVPNQSTLPSPSPPFVLCPTPPPPLSTQQGFPVLSNPHPPVLLSHSNPHPPVLLSHTPPPTTHSYPFSAPAMRHPMPPQHYLPYH